MNMTLVTKHHLV